MYTNIDAGILAGLWPGGVITLASELYLAESNSQVYGSIHSFLHLHSKESQDLRKLRL